MGSHDIGVTDGCPPRTRRVFSAHQHARFVASLYSSLGRGLLEDRPADGVWLCRRRASGYRFVGHFFFFCRLLLLLVFFVSGTVRTWGTVCESAGVMGRVEVSTIDRCPILAATGMVMLDAKCKSGSRDTRNR